jgi:GNAT superfamily N-acetyltransferase
VKPVDAAVVEVVRAGEGDIEALVPLFNAYRQFFNPVRDEHASQPFLSARFRDGDTVVFLSRVDGNACGFIQLYPLWSSWYCRRIWFLSDLYVAEAYREHGIGKMLVERVKAFAAQTGAGSVMVELPHSEPHLTEFYDRLGFHRDPVFDLARYHPK